MGEFDLIAKYFAPLVVHKGALGLTDDASILHIPAGHEAVITKDVMIEGVHYPEGTDPSLVARKLLRVNLSDLAAMGATPLGYWLGCQLPRAEAEPWLKAFCKGLEQDQNEFGFSLMGGDTVATPGPVALSLTAMGTVPTGQALRRSGAKPGDQIWVSGTIGDGCLGLVVVNGDGLGLSTADQDYLKGQLDLPSPRCGLGMALRGLASAAIDVSDGLAADAGHLAQASQVILQIDADCVPLSAAAKNALNTAKALLDDLVSGGDDFELLFTAPPANAAAIRDAAKGAKVEATMIGEVVSGAGEVQITVNGVELALKKSGFTHF